MYKRLILATLAIVGLTPSHSMQTQEAEYPIDYKQSVASDNEVAEIIKIPAMTLIAIEIIAPISSKTAKVGEMFPIKLSQPIYVGGNLIVPMGAKGYGEVVHAAKARAAGKAGELIIAARYLEWYST